MSSALTWLSLGIIAIVLVRDWGHRRVTVWSLLRPLVLAAVIVPFVMPGWVLTGKGGLLELAAIVVGACLGVAISAIMRVTVDENGQAWTDAGVAYMAAWVVVTGARQIFIYGCEHWFSRAVGEFLINNQISVKAFADAIMFLTLTTVVANRLAVLVRARVRSARVAEPALVGGDS